MVSEDGGSGTADTGTVFHRVNLLHSNLRVHFLHPVDINRNEI